MEKADAEEDVSSELDNTKSGGDCSATATPFLLPLLSSFERTKTIDNKTKIIIIVNVCFNNA
ncbi:hypothetical protein GCM10008982_33780 [Anoxybacillus voinovskiensis]|nr:hypothetical protein GCM10008982_33780 [Anoxybacillus voinovskiensis]